MSSIITDIFSNPGNAWADADWAAAAELWDKAPKQATVTGKCVSNQCHIDFHRFKGRGAHDLDAFLKGLQLPMSFWVACHEDAPCLKANDLCTWRSHPAQAANCQSLAEPGRSQLLIKNNGKLNPKNDEPLGRSTRIMDDMAGHREVIYMYNSRLLDPLMLKCIFPYRGPYPTDRTFTEGDPHVFLFHPGGGGALGE